MKLDFGARMNIPITKHELFSTPVYEDEVFISPSSAEIMKDEVLDYAYKETGISDLSINYYTSSNSLSRFKISENFERLHDEIEKTVSNTFDVDNYIIKHSWVNVVAKEIPQSLHRHCPQDKISAILYFDNIGETLFADPRVQVYGSPRWKSKAMPGKLLFFPSYLYHEVHKHDDERRRVVFACDLIKDER